MQDNIKENILNELKRKDGKRIIICQTGFISTKFLVNCLNYRIEYDTLTIQDEKEGVYLSINLNQVYKYEIKEFKQFYGMSSQLAQEKHFGGMANYRASEGKVVEIPYKGSVENVIQEILGGIRSTMSYIGAKRLKDIPKCTTFYRVNRQLNEVFGKS